MKEFNFYEYVTQNKTTPSTQLAETSKRMLTEKSSNSIEDTEEDTDDEFATEPTGDDIQKVSKGVSGQSEKGAKLSTLVKQKDILIQRLKDSQITIEEYRKLIGTIPQQIKTLTADLAKLTDIEDEEEEPIGEETEMLEVEEMAEKIEGVLQERHSRAFTNAVTVITEDLQRRGYESKEISDYLTRKISQLHI